MKDAELASSIGFAYNELMTVLWMNDAGRTLLRGQSSRDEWWENIQSIDARLQNVEQSFIWNDLFGNSWIDTELVDYVRSISHELPISIFTNCDTEEKHTILEQLGDRHPFTTIITSADIGFVKPDSTAFQRMLTIVDAAPQECLFLDDSSGNVMAARGIGIEGAVYSGLESFKAIIKIVLDSLAS
ncbi:MAG: HAD-IA family hydrolase [Candidatus Bathyarchaeota archaeon]|nr:HAD-IA family hydrolase [Candidatus Bathyarchaeota archaeon]